MSQGIQSRQRWVSFDCFGTLVDWNSGFRAILTDLFGARTDEVIRAYHKFEPAIEAEKPHRLYREVLSATLQKAASSTGVTLDGQNAQQLAKDWNEQTVFGDVERTLSELRALGCRLAVLTNCDDDLFAAIHRKFQEPFDLVVTAERVQDYKPSLTHFRTFQQMTGVRLVDWVHVACSWFHDIAPAREYGIRSIWLDRDRTGHEPFAATVRLDSAEQLAEKVRRLFAGESQGP